MASSSTWLCMILDSKQPRSVPSARTTLLPLCVSAFRLGWAVRPDSWLRFPEAIGKHTRACCGCHIYSFACSLLWGKKCLTDCSYCNSVPCGFKTAEKPTGGGRGQSPCPPPPKVPQCQEEGLLSKEAALWNCPGPTEQPTVSPSQVPVSLRAVPRPCPASFTTQLGRVRLGEAAWPQAARASLLRLHLCWEAWDCQVRTVAGSGDFLKEGR